MVPLKYLSNFWRTLKIPLINWEFNVELNWSKKCVIVATAVVTAVAKLYVPVVNSSTHNNAKLLEQLKSGFKRTINWNKYQSKILTERSNQYQINQDYLIDPSFQGVNKLFVLSVEDEAKRTICKRYYLPTVEIENYNVMIDGQNFFDQPIRNN